MGNGEINRTANIGCVSPVTQVFFAFLAETNLNTGSCLDAMALAARCGLRFLADRLCYMPGIMPFMLRIIFIMPPPLSFFIIVCIWSNWASIRFTS